MMEHCFFSFFIKIFKGVLLSNQSNFVWNKVQTLIGSYSKIRYHNLQLTDLTNLPGVFRSITKISIQTIYREEVGSRMISDQGVDLIKLQNTYSTYLESQA